MNYSSNKRLTQELKKFEYGKRISPAACQQQAQKRKMPRKKFWMRGLFWLFSVLYLALCSIPVYFAWAERFTFKNGLSEGGKVYLTSVMAVVAVGCIYVAWYQYRRWAKNYD